MPVLMTATDVIKHHAKCLVGVLKDELELERRELGEKLYRRTLERIFVEERIYKAIEAMKSAETVAAAVVAGFVPHAEELAKLGHTEVSDEDVDMLLKIPIRRISLYDINKNREEVKAINDRLKEIARLLKGLTAYAIAWLTGILAKLDPKTTARRTKVTTFSAVDVKEVSRKDIPLLYDAKSGYLGTQVTTGTAVLQVSEFDRVIYLRKNGFYTIISPPPDRLFVDTGLWYCGKADKEALSPVLFTVIYRDAATHLGFIKRCRIEGYIMHRDYLIVPEGAEVLHVDTRPKFAFTVHYAPKPRSKVATEVFKAESFLERGLKAGGIRVGSREIEGVSSE
jgi:topoisomerase-4 subunit A